MKCSIFVVAIAGLGLAVSQTARAAELAGIALDQPVSLNECSERQRNYLPDDRPASFKLPAAPSRDPYSAAAKPPVNSTIVVNVARAARPDFMSGSDAVVALRDGHVASISVRTHGTRGEADDFRALTDAFGHASPRPVVPWNTGGNGPVQTQTSLRADWTLPGGDTAHFNSGKFGVYFGLVRLQKAAAPPHQNGV
ncbi:MAG: hypothetical protein ABIU96_14315 [Rhodanobacter sp.]